MANRNPTPTLWRVTENDAFRCSPAARKMSQAQLEEEYGKAKDALYVEATSKANALEVGRAARAKIIQAETQAKRRSA